MQKQKGSKGRKNLFSDLFHIIFGCIPLAFSISVFMVSNHLSPGGVSGMATILSHLTGIKVSLWMLLLNLPLLWMGWRKFGWKFLSETLYATLVSAGMTNLLTALAFIFEWPPLHRTVFWAALLGGLFQAVGIGLIFREGGTTGGTDIVVHLLHHRWNRLSAGWIFLTVDTAVILLAYLTGVGLKEVLYAILSLIVFSSVFGWMTRENLP